jgi:hypothetical protein
MNFQRLFNKPGFILTEGAVVERLKNEFDLVLDKYVNHAGLIYESPDIIIHFYRQYIGIAQQYSIPLMLMTPTRKVNFETIRNSKFSARNLISDSCGLLKEIRSQYPNDKKVFPQPLCYMANCIHPLNDITPISIKN